MAMELFVLSDELLNSTADWQAAIDGEGYPLRLDGIKPINRSKVFCRRGCVIQRLASNAISGQPVSSCVKCQA